MKTDTKIREIRYKQPKPELKCVRGKERERERERQADREKRIQR